MIRLVVISELTGGGVESVNTTLAQNINQEFFDVTVLSVHSIPKDLTEINPSYKCVSLNRTSIKRSCLKIIITLRRIQPDIILCSILDEAFVCLLYKKLYNRRCKLLYAQHTVWSTVYNTGFKGRVFNKWLPHITNIYSKLDGLIYVSEGVRDDFRREFKKVKTIERVIYNPITADDSHFLFRILKQNKVSIVTAGRLEKEKRQKLLIAAAKKLKDEGVDVDITFYGKGTLLGDLKLYSEELGMREQVRFPGFIKHLIPAFMQYDIFVLTSDYESFGNVLVEAMNTGMPVVSTDCPVGPREILDNGRYGELVKMRDAESVAKGIKYSIETYNNNKAKDILRRSMDFSIKASCSQYGNMFMTVLKKQKI